jgi:hypothetical protein
MMKSIGILSTTALFLLLGFTPMANARQEKQEEKASPPKQEQARPEKQQEAKAPKQEQQAKPEKQQQAKAPKQEQQAKPEKQQQAKAPKQEQQAKPEKQQQAKAPKQEQQQAKAPKQEEKVTKGQQEQAKSDKQQQTQQAKGQQQQQVQKQTASSNGPQRTQAETTRQHAQPALRLSARGSGRIPDERFRSNFGRGHEFRMGNPVMVGGYSRFQYGGYWFGYVQPWPADWYYTDQFYIDYVDGGYYMYDPYYPRARFAITVVI